MRETRAPMRATDFDDIPVSGCGRLHTEILDMKISAETWVVSEVPAGVVGVVINNDVIRVPAPTVSVGKVKRRNVPVPSVEPEAAWIAAGEMPHMMRTKAAGPAAVLPGAIETIMRIVTARIVADPDAAVDMGLRWMTIMVAEVVMLAVVVRRAAIRCGPAGRHAGVLVLSECRNCKNKQPCENEPG